MKNTIKIFLIITIFFIPSSAFACSFAYSDPEETYEQSEIVFIGQIIGLKHEGGLNGTREVTFDVLKTYKGNLSNQITLETGANSAMCGYDDGTLSEGQIMVVNTHSYESFNSHPNNKTYESFEEAELEIDSIADADEPVFCTLQYDPVCGQIDTGIRCITTPCDTFEEKTYSNKCMMNVDKATFLYEGECKIDTVTVPDSPKNDPETDVPVIEEPSSDSPVENTKQGILKRIWNFLLRILGL